MSARRNSSLLQDAVERLLKKEKGWGQFQPKPAVGARPGVVGTGLPASSAGGAAGSFVEASFEQREYHAERQVTSSDGVFVMRYKPIKKIVGDDGRTLEFKEPPA